VRINVLTDHRGYAATVKNGADVFIASDNTETRFDLFKVGDSSWWGGTLYTTPPSTRLPKQVAFSEGGCLLVGGSDHGIVYVYETSSRKCITKLRHHGIMVQTVAVSFVNYYT
jgi:hypothetical protein